MNADNVPWYLLAVFLAKEVYTIFLGRAKEDREDVKTLQAALVKTQVSIEAIRSDLRFFSRLRYDLDALWVKERERSGTPRPSDRGEMV